MATRSKRPRLLIQAIVLVCLPPEPAPANRCWRLPLKCRSSVLLSARISPSKAIGDALLGCGWHRPLVDLRFSEQPEKLGVDFIGPNAVGQYAQRTVNGHRALIGPVRGGERVENVANGHHLSWQRNRIAAQLVGI